MCKESNPYLQNICNKLYSKLYSFENDFKTIETTWHLNLLLIYSLLHEFLAILDPLVFSSFITALYSATIKQKHQELKINLSDSNKRLQ